MSAFLSKIKENKVVKNLIWLFPAWYLYEVIMGFNGYQFTIAGKSIRIVLFCLALLALCSYCLYVVLSSKMSILKRKDTVPFFFDFIRPFDYVVVGFLFINLIWATAVPLLVRGNMAFGLKDYSTLLVLVLYFPVVFLMRNNRLNFKTVENIFYAFTIVLAVWHSVMYIGDTIHSGFYESYYDFIDIISFGTAVRTDVVYGFGIIRVIQTTSVLLLPGVFISLKKLVNGSLLHSVSLLIFTFAICVTYTKSIWFGYLAGLFICFIGCLIFAGEKRKRLRVGATFVLSLLIIVVLNSTVFNNTIYERALNTVGAYNSIGVLQQELENAEDDKTKEELSNKLKDALGTQEANSIRAKQNNALLEKWSENKVFGIGYGGYAEKSIRNEQFPYMYESTLPALLMKIGVLGCLGWLVFIALTTITSIKVSWKGNRLNAFFWLGIALSYAMAVQTNPFLFTFPGITILLYLLIIFQDKKSNI